MVWCRGLDVATCPAIHRCFGRFSTFTAIVRKIVGIRVSLYSLFFFYFVFNLLSKNSSSDGTKHPGLLFCRSVQPSGPGRPTLRDNGNGLSSSGSVYVLEVFAGETAVLPCPPPPSDPPATITFFKDGKPVINNGTTLTSITVFYLFRVELFSFGFYFFFSSSLGYKPMTV